MHKIAICFIIFNAFTIQFLSCKSNITTNVKQNVTNSTLNQTILN